MSFQTYRGKFISVSDTKSVILLFVVVFEKNYQVTLADSLKETELFQVNLHGTKISFRSRQGWYLSAKDNGAFVVSDR